ncbi:MAG: hypothetical protein NXI12_05345 [Alphaproteobacteria bacterium]|nr:hypothetical protein [Alphaproteobacteria bacterium]
MTAWFRTALSCGFTVFSAAVLAAGCSGARETASDGPNIPLDLLPRVLAHAAAEELREPQERCESDQRDETWLALADRLRAYDRALRGGPGVEDAPQTDAEISALLQDAVAERGWPHPCDLGDRASKQLWLVVQHSPDRELLGEGLDYFEQAAAYGFVPASQVVTLRDRIRMRAGEPQVYGTQYLCDPQTGRRVRWRTEDADGLAERRRRAGLIPASWELRIMNHHRAPCGGDASP